MGIWTDRPPSWLQVRALRSATASLRRRRRRQPLTGATIIAASKLNQHRLTPSRHHATTPPRHYAPVYLSERITREGGGCRRNHSGSRGRRVRRQRSRNGRRDTAIRTSSSVAELAGDNRQRSEHHHAPFNIS